MPDFDGENPSRKTRAAPESEPPQNQKEPGLVDSLRGLANAALGTIHDRVELASIELKEEKYRLIQIFLCLVIFGFTALLALLFVSAGIVLAFWNTAARLPIVIGIGALYTVAAGVAALALRRRIMEQPDPFASTLAELRRDQSCLPPKN